MNEIIPDFGILFLTTLLSYRFKEKLINNTWSFDDNFYYNQIFLNYNNYYHNLISSYISNSTLAKIYISDKLVLYEYSTVYINENSFPNCMENVIFQFLKILFWNGDKYDEKVIEKLVINNEQNNILEFFKNINDEKKSEYINKWTDYIYLKLP
jgi:hypothetical protein